MKKNADNAMVFIHQALRETGGDFALSNARRYLIAALNELTKVQTKRIKRKNVYKLEEERRQKNRLSFEEARLRLTKLDEMLKAETKLQNGSNPSESP